MGPEQNLAALIRDRRNTDAMENKVIGRAEAIL